VKVRDAAVCTSDNYARRYRIGEQWFTRVMDPRTGTPATTVASVTVVGAAATDGAWTTALGVLGPAGLDKLPASVQARVVTGEANNCQTYVSPGFARHASPVGGRTGGATAPTSTPATPSGAAPGHVGAFAGRDAPRYSRAGRPCYAGSAA
jgi:hypothetical protein